MLEVSLFSSLGYAVDSLHGIMPLEYKMLRGLSSGKLDLEKKQTHPDTKLLNSRSILLTPTISSKL